MKIAFLLYHDVLEDRVTKLLIESGVDFYTEWEHVKGKGHGTEPHLGTRTFPGYNCVRMIAFENKDVLRRVKNQLENLNKEIIRADDHVRLFQIPLETVL
jgi:hypothetical protein